jgi:hypothetical protein
MVRGIKSHPMKSVCRDLHFVADLDPSNISSVCLTDSLSIIELSPTDESVGYSQLPVPRAPRGRPSISTGRFKASRVRVTDD